VRVPETSVAQFECNIRELVATTDICSRKIWHCSCGILVGPIKAKVKHPRTGHEGPEGSRGIALLFHDLGPGWDWVVHAMPLATLPPRKETQYPLYRKLGGPQGRSGQLRKISTQLGFDLQTVQLVASRHTDYAIPAPNKSIE